MKDSQYAFQFYPLHYFIVEVIYIYIILCVCLRIYTQSLIVHKSSQGSVLTIIFICFTSSHQNLTISHQFPLIVFGAGF